MTTFPAPSSDRNDFFINISDGEPTVSAGHGSGRLDYSDVIAVEHTRSIVNKIRKCGYEVMSYFVVESERPSTAHRLKSNFKRMYGKDAEFIDVRSLNQILSTFNKKLIESLDI